MPPTSRFFYVCHPWPRPFVPSLREVKNCSRQFFMPVICTWAPIECFGRCVIRRMALSVAIPITRFRLVFAGMTAVDDGLRCLSSTGSRSTCGHLTHPKALIPEHSVCCVNARRLGSRLKPCPHNPASISPHSAVADGHCLAVPSNPRNNLQKNVQKQLKTKPTLSSLG